MNSNLQKLPQGVLDIIKNHTINRKNPSMEQISSSKNLQKWRVRHSQVNNIRSYDDQENVCKTLQSNNRKAAIKLKLLRSKKRSIKKCQLGIGFQLISTQIPKTKVYHQFFPQRTLTMFKKLAFKNWNAKQQSQKLCYQKIKFSSKNQKSDSQLRGYRQKTSLQIKNPVQTQLKIVSLGQSFHFKISELSNKSFDRIQIKKKNLDKKASFSHIQKKDQSCTPWDALGPWSFQEVEL